MKNRVAFIPKIADYNAPLGKLIERCVGCKTFPNRPLTTRTVELGSKHSPDTVCTPYKIIMGEFIEFLEKHKNPILLMPGFGCRLGFYDMLHEQTLRELGYTFDMVAWCDYTATPNKIFGALNKLNPELTREEFDNHFAVTCAEIADMDAKAFATRRKVDPTKPSLKIGIVGDLYTVMEPHGNCHMEDWLKKNNIDIVRYCDLTYLALNIFDIPKLLSQSGGYLKYNLGGNANCSIAQAYKLMSQDKVDGIIHVKAATCAPEISAMSILQTMSKDFDVAMMYLTFDTETSDAGLHTRLEAFCDMLHMKNKNLSPKTCRPTLDTHKIRGKIPL